MARDHEMVGTEASVPKRVLMSHHIDVISEGANELVSGIGGDGPVDVGYDIGNAHWQEEGVGLVGTAGQEGAEPALQLVDELALDTVYVAHWPLMHQRQLSFPVAPYLESLHHLDMTPDHHHSADCVIIMKKSGVVTRDGNFVKQP